MFSISSSHNVQLPVILLILGILTFLEIRCQILVCRFPDLVPNQVRVGFKIVWISARMLDLRFIRYGKCHHGL